MAIDRKPNQISEAEAVIKAAAKPRADLKGTTANRLTPEVSVPAKTPFTTEELAYERFRILALMENGQDLTESLPVFETLFDEPVYVGDQKMESRADVARNVDRLTAISDIAQGRYQPSREYNLDFSGFPVKPSTGSQPSGNWNKLSSQPIKVDKNFVLNGSFDQAFQIVLASEGGFSNHQADKGGATIYGIAARSNPKEYQMIMDQLARGDTAGAIETTKRTYKTKYWDSVQGIENMSASAKLVAFDAAINHGVGFANKMSRATNADTDGMIAYRSQKYASIIQNDPSQSVFEKGWGNRLAKLDALTETSERNSLSLAAAPSVKLPERAPA